MARFLLTVHADYPTEGVWDQTIHTCEYQTRWEAEEDAAHWQSRSDDEEWITTDIESYARTATAARRKAAREAKAAAAYEAAAPARLAAARAAWAAGDTTPATLPSPAVCAGQLTFDQAAA